MKLARPRRPGLTRVELVILIVVGLFLLGLGLMGLLRARAASLRLGCANNLKQLGEATFRFQDASGSLPPSRIAPSYATWAVVLGPYLEKAEGQPLRTWDLLRPYYEQTDVARLAQSLGYYCPARREPQASVSGDVPRDGAPLRDNFPGALGDYAASAGDGSGAEGALIDAGVTLTPDRRVRTWHGRTAMRLMQAEGKPVVQVGTSDLVPPLLKELKRGTSSTVLLGEKHVPWGAFGQTGQGDGSLYNGDYLDSFSRVGGVGFGLAQSGNDPFRRNFGSAHPGVCQFLMADGSVRPLANGISPEVLGKLLVREQPE